MGITVLFVKLVAYELHLGIFNRNPQSIQFLYMHLLSTFQDQGEPLKLQPESYFLLQMGLNFLIIIYH